MRRRPPSQNRKKARRGVTRESKAPRLTRETARLLSHIGKPEPRPFTPDPFQVEAVERIVHEDVLVSAPTGSGKTWIAVEATKQYLAAGRSVWYTTPLKALSNAKYEEFGQIFGAHRVGILTGDRKENPDAPVIVGTTEILRNQLYDSMQSGFDLGVDLVILDEAHYLGDPDRGVVWEEVIIYLPERVRLLLLSATIPNAAQVARWLKRIRRKSCAVVRSDIRPVPLYVLFRTPQGELTPFLRSKKLYPKAAAFAEAVRRSRRFNDSGAPDMNGIVETLREFKLLPAIVFLKSRADCDRALLNLRPSPVSPEEGGFAQILEEKLSLYPELKNQRHIRLLLECRAGSHHAGQLPTWRLLVEKMMVLGHLEVILSTSTVAAGVNFPARTVVILQSDRFNGQSFVELSATDFHQMTGRAGRRGMDNAGYTLVVPGRYLDVKVVQKRLLSDPEPLQSKITVSFSMILNLLLSHDPDGVRALLKRSFASFHEDARRAQKVHRKLLKDFNKHLNLLEELDYVDERGVPTYDGKWAARLRLDHPLIIAELIRREAFDNLDPQELAAVVAPFVQDKDKEIVVSRELWGATRPLWKRFRRLMQDLKPLMGFMVARGFEVPPVMFWPAASVYLWGEGVEWDTLTEHVDADEGDLAMLILRTADHVRQLVSLEGEQPRLADAARRTLESLMRAPLV